MKNSTKPSDIILTAFKQEIAIKKLHMRFKCFPHNGTLFVELYLALPFKRVIIQNYYVITNAKTNSQSK